MSTQTLDEASARFEKTWNRAMASGDAKQQAVKPDTRIVPNYFLPESTLQGLRELVTHCLKRKLISGEQHTLVCDCLDKQLAVFCSIDPEALKALILEVDFD